MQNKQDYYRYLMRRYIAGDLSMAEAQELFDYLAENTDHAQALLSEEDRKRFEEKLLLNPALAPEISGRVLRLLDDAMDADGTGIDLPRERRIGEPSIVKWWWAAAAAMVIMTTAYFSLIPSRSTESGTLHSGVMHDVDAPKSTQAVVILGDGTRILLEDGVASGTLAKQGNVNLVKRENGEIVYQPSGNEPTESISFNTLANPRGSRAITLQLADGSKVWLNSESSITYPVQFNDKKREVSITGEAYFEVARSVDRPFIVYQGDLNITVLGTRFNVNAYADETHSEVTLFEGSVRVGLSGDNVLLAPGQQARADVELKVMDDVNLESVMAWKDGLFRFDNAGIEAIMRQVARWYDLRVIYEGKISDERFHGTMSMDTKLSELLEVLELNKVEYSIMNKTITIKSNEHLKN